MAKTTYLMETNSGAVDTLENWKRDWELAKAEGTWEELGWPEKWEDNTLVEVVKDSEGSWVEAE